MEMYADKEARGGVLEPEGIVEIKYRRDKVLATMARLDKEYAALKAASQDASTSAEEQAAAKDKLAAREKHLMPTYQQIALLYSDLHDRVGRMEAKGCARAAEWSEARRYFYWRLRRKINEQHMLNKLATAHPGHSAKDRTEMLDELIQSEDRTDRAVALWLESHGEVITEFAGTLSAQYIGDKIVEFAERDPNGTIAGFMAVMDSLSPEDKQAIMARYQPNGGA